MTFTAHIKPHLLFSHKAKAFEKIDFTQVDLPGLIQAHACEPESLLVRASVVLPCLHF